jgi:hypothetical protein
MAFIMNRALGRTERTASHPKADGHDEILIDKPSLDEWILGALQRRRSQTIDQLAVSLVDVNWSEFFLAIDRLTKSGVILLWPSPIGDAVLSLNVTDWHAVEQDSSSQLVGSS